MTVDNKMKISGFYETENKSEMNEPYPKLTYPRKYNIGHMLLDMGKITPTEAESILRLQKESGLRFGDAALKLGFITEEDVKLVLSQQFDYPYLLPGQGNYSPELIVAYQPFGSQVEVFRAIRSQLMLRWYASGHKALAIVGHNLSDGVSLFAANLAVVFSQLGERTLLIDANLRNPSQHEIFNINNKHGLADILAERVEISEVIYRIDSFIDLSVLPAGTQPPNPLELLNRSSFDKLNEQLANQYDVMLYDTAAISNGADALAVAGRTEGVLVVAKKNDSRLTEINALNEQLQSCGAEIVGSILID